ncbi:major capsid protein [Caudoviricetes sp.]|nr:major capsid protein [Caudoviricetes sp.]
MSQLTTNTTAFIEAQQYSQFILENLHDYLLPEGLMRDVSDFGSGTTLNIKTVGTVTLQDAAEDIPLVFNPIDTGTITLAITDYIGDAWRVSDDLREDGSQIDALMAMRAMESTRALGEQHESRFLSVANLAQTNAAVNLVNARPHRWIAGGAGVTTRVMSMSDIIAMKLAFDKANVPAAGRIAIVDPIVEATLNSLTNLVNVSNNPMFEGMVTEGFARDHKFIRNIFGFDFYTSNFLPVKTATEAINAAAYGLANTTAAIGDVANIFMCVADDSCKPIMHAWRRSPSTEGWRDPEGRGDKFQVTSRFGFGAQRVDTLGVILTTSATY